jgi:GntR family transcriptional regulator
LNIEHDSSTPKYVQIKDHIRRHIESGQYASNTRLPSERQLAEEFEVSRLTVTKALKELEQEGLIYSRVGKGTFVTPQAKIDQSLETLTSFSEEMRAKQKRASSQVLYAAIEGASEEVARALTVPVGTDVFSLKRLRFADGQIIALEHSHIVYTLCPNILEHHDFAQESLYQVLGEVYGLRLTIAHQTVESRLATRDEAKVLQISPSDPVLSFTRVTLNDKHMPVEFVLSVYPGDRYKLHITLKPTS